MESYGEMSLYQYLGYCSTSEIMIRFEEMHPLYIMHVKGILEDYIK
jgi:hypothetical protein